MTVAVCVFLGGCSGGGSMESLHRFVATADAGYRPRVKPVPKISLPHIVAFDMQHFADPFEPFSMRLPARGPNPNQNRPKGPLQQYPLDVFTMVGTFSSGPNLWAIVSTPDGAVHRVRVGTYMGEHFGRVVRITAKNIRVMQTVAGPSGWVKQPVMIEIK
ncbi:MAG TPA: pilus assembly protein PilP [Acidiferrobacter sp.]|nr:pilus assembly protein PilP [Acidiferrobacter sp.]